MEDGRDKGKEKWQGEGEAERGLRKKTSNKKKSKNNLPVQLNRFGRNVVHHPVCSLSKRTLDWTGVGHRSEPSSIAASPAATAATITDYY